MKSLLVALILILPVTLLGTETDQVAFGKLKKFSKTSAVAQANQDAEANNFLVTDPAGPFRFQKVGRIRKITRISITLTLDDADTGPGDSDQNQLSLALDGIDTGILLNGFESGQSITQTLSGVPLNEPAIRAALKADGQLAASILDADPGAPNGVLGSSANTTTLVITGKQKQR